MIKEKEFKKPRVKLIYTDTEIDVISILRCIRSILLEAGYEKQANDFLIEASQGTEDKLLQIASKYLDIC